MKKLMMLLAVLWPLAAHASLSVEAIQGAAWSSGTTIVLPAITTTESNEPIVVFVANNGSGVNSVTSTHLTFTSRAVAGSPDIEEWTALAASPLSSEVVTVTFAGTPSYGVASICGVLGTPSTSYFDTNASIPVANNTAANPVFSTTAANTIVLSGMRFSGTGSPTAGSGWTPIYDTAGEYFLVEYKVFSSPQSSTAVSVGTGSADENGSIVDALVSASGPICNAACAARGFLGF